MHSLQIAHRDLKPEALLCSPSNDYFPFRVAISKFDLAKYYGGGELLQTSCGTPEHAGVIKFSHDSLKLLRLSLLKDLTLKHVTCGQQELLHILCKFYQI